MRPLLTLLLCGFLPLLLSCLNCGNSTSLLLSYAGTSVRAQVMGNYQRQNNAPSTSNYRAQFRAVPQTAEFAPDGSLVFSINALSNQTADSYVAIFSVFQTGKTAPETNDGINRRIDAIKSALTAIGVPREDVYVDLVNFLPTYGYTEDKRIFSKTTFTEVPTGFQLQKNLHIRYRDPELLDRILTAAATQEVYDIIKVDYQIARPSEVYAEMRRLAFDYLDQIEEVYAGQGIGLDTFNKTIAENAFVTYPGDRYQSYTAFASQKLSADQRSGSVVDQAEKPQLRFYDAIPPNDYDLVINPDVLEPSAQFSFSLKVRYVKPVQKVQVRTKVDTRYYMLTPDGELKPIAVPGPRE